MKTIMKVLTLLACNAFLAAACTDNEAFQTAIQPPDAPIDGQAPFRYDTYDDEALWTDVLRFHEVVATVSPEAALAVGLKVDAEAVLAEPNRGPLMKTATATIPKSFSHFSDDLILARVIGGDLEAYEGIMRHHNQRLYRIARSIVTDDAEAADVVQETFIAAFERLHELKDPAALPAWLARITRNSALMRLRKSRRMHYMDEPEFDNVLNLSTAIRRPEQPESALANKQLRQMLEQFIDELPDAFRAVFMLRAIEQCTVATTAELLEIEAATVKTRYHPARVLLQKRLMEYSDSMGVTVHEFAGHRCDAIVCKVLEKLRSTHQEMLGDVTTD
jgi:RNA polymerase sigma-70 factor (ECF subfamily)